MSALTVFGLTIDDSDIVKIATVLITASVAVFLFFLNQSFTRAKEKRELTTEKIEELFLATANFSDKSLNSIDFAMGNFNALTGHDPEIQNEVEKIHAKNISELFIDITKVQMLLDLYFRKHKKHSKYPLTPTCNLKQILLDIDSKSVIRINGAKDSVVRAEQKIYLFCLFLAEYNQSPFYKKWIL